MFAREVLSPDEFNDSPKDLLVTGYFVPNEMCEPNRKMVTCPFNSSHHVKQSKFPSHLIKCKKQHPNHRKVACWYNGLEYIDIDKIDEHVKVCKYKLLYDTNYMLPSKSMDDDQVMNMSSRCSGSTHGRCANSGFSKTVSTLHDEYETCSSNGNLSDDSGSTSFSVVADHSETGFFNSRKNNVRVAMSALNLNTPQSASFYSSSSSSSGSPNSGNFCRGRGAYVRSGEFQRPGECLNHKNL